MKEPRTWGVVRAYIHHDISGVQWVMTRHNDGLWHSGFGHIAGWDELTVVERLSKGPKR